MGNSCLFLKILFLCEIHVVLTGKMSGSFEAESLPALPRPDILLLFDPAQSGMPETAPGRGCWTVRAAVTTTNAASRHVRRHYDPRTHEAKAHVVVPVGGRVVVPIRRTQVPRNVVPTPAPDHAIRPAVHRLRSPMSHICKEAFVYMHIYGAIYRLLLHEK